MELAHAVPLASALSALHKLRKDGAGDLSAGDLASGGGLKPTQQASPAWDPNRPKKPLRVVLYQGIPVHVDRPAGTVQKGVGPDGKPWTRVYHVDYGFIPGTRGGDEHAPEMGKDGQLDAYLGLMADAPEAHWIVQKKDDGSFDEYKLMLGFVDPDSARAMWQVHTPKRYFGGMSSTSVEMVKSLLGMRPQEAVKVLKALADAGVAREMLADALLQKVLRHESDGWHVYSADGSKHLGGPYSKADAVERLRQVEGHREKADGILPAGARVEPSVPPHMPEASGPGTVREVDPGPAYGVEFDAAPGKVHRWYVGSELRSLGPAPAQKAAGQIVLAELRKGAEGEELRYVLAPVLVPDVVDAQGDTYSEDEVRKAEWEYMKRFRNVGLMHKQLVNGKVNLVESYCAPADMLVEGSRISKGTWMMGLNVVDDALWADVKSGRLTGLSIGGVATKTPV